MRLVKGALRGGGDDAGKVKLVVLADAGCERL